MQIHEVVEVVFTILLLLFLAMMVIAIMTFITVVEELNSYDVPFTMRVVFITGMSMVYIYLLKMMVSKFTDYHRYL